MGRAISIVDYDRQWPGTFERLRMALAPALGDLALAIEHIGSTAVPGLAGKPVIDMDVIVPDGRVRDATRALERIGYISRGDLGIPGREAFERPPTLPAHHLYVCPESSPALAAHIRFRDYLRANPTAAAEYGALKSRLAAESATAEEYTAGKSTFIERALNPAGTVRRMVGNDHK